MVAAEEIRKLLQDVQSARTADFVTPLLNDLDRYGYDSELE
jgi:hypothetical protein